MSYGKDDLYNLIHQGPYQWHQVENYDFTAYWTERDRLADIQGVSRWQVELDIENFKHPEPRVTPNLVRDEDEDCLSFDEFREHLEASGDQGVILTGLAVGGLAIAYLVETFGGEGEGDQYWYVFKVVDDNEYSRFWKVDGYYQSYSGGYYDEIYEVFPKKVEVTQWTQDK